MEHALSMKGISKSFGEKNVLKKIDLEVKSGEIFGLIGPSGAGKTTIIKILTGQLKADSGTSVIGGIDSLSLKPEDYGGFGIMMDNFGLYDRLNCCDNLKIFADIYGLNKNTVHQALSAVGLTGNEKTAAAKLSKGMKSRLRLARALITDPDILFLDEPTSGLDPASAEDIRQMLLNEKKRGKTIFLTTHNMSEAEKLCDSIALLLDGGIAEYGSPTEICRRYDHKKTICIHMKNGTDKILPHSPKSAEAIAYLLSKDLIETIHTSEPTLETVFMELTGKELAS